MWQVSSLNCCHLCVAGYKYKLFMFACVAAHKYKLFMFMCVAGHKYKLFTFTCVSSHKYQLCMFTCVAGHKHKLFMFTYVVGHKCKLFTLLAGCDRSAAAAGQRSGGLWGAGVSGNVSPCPGERRLAWHCRSHLAACWDSQSPHAGLHCHQRSAQNPQTVYQWWSQFAWTQLCIVPALFVSLSIS